ncbi:MAG TPA: 6-bladed beta-propeller [Thiotrichaceae bacterium]|nr:6-bladed beta-propeller [Thiotrichaceae bacterium]
MRTFKQLLWILCLNSVVVFAASTDKEHYVFERLWPTLPQPWHFERAIDLAVDQQGNVYVLNQTTRQIQKFTSNGHFIRQWRFGDDTPHEIEIGNSGNVYILYAQEKIVGNNEGLMLIRVLSANGELICEWGEIGEGQHRHCPESLSSTLDKQDFKYNLSSETLAVDSRDHLYLFEEYNDQNQHIILQKFTPDGHLVHRWPIPAPIKRHKHLDITISPQDELYLVYQGDGLVFKYQITDKTITLQQQWEGFNRPEDIALDSHNNVYVVDRGNFRVVRKLASMNHFEPWVFSEIEIQVPDENELGFLLNMFYESPETYAAFQNRLPVSNIRKLLDDFFKTRVLDISTGPNELFLPWAIAIGGSEDNIYLTNNAVNDSVRRYSPAGTFITEWTNRASGDGQFYLPFGIARDSQGYLYVTDTFNHRVLKFTEKGQFINAWGKSGFKRGEFVIPIGITVDKEDNIYVVDTGNLRIQKFDANGQFLAQWGGIKEPKSLPTDPNERFEFVFKQSEFLFPINVAVDSQGNLYVIDWIRNNVKKMSQSGQIDEAFAQSPLGLGYFGDGQGELKSPSSLTIDPDDNIYVLDT